MPVNIVQSIAHLENRHKNSIFNLAAAGRECMESASIPMDGAHIFVNLGTYCFHNIAEPALSALIQKEMGHALDYVPGRGASHPVSFDLINGGCGFLNAVQVAQAFVAETPETIVLATAGEGHPSGEDIPGFPLATTAAAVAFGRAGEGKGFGRVAFLNSPDFFAGMSSYVDLNLQDRDNRISLDLEIDPEYGPRALELAATAVKKYCNDEQLDVSDVILVTATCAQDFGVHLAKMVGGDEAKVSTVPGLTGDANSSSLILGYHHALESGLLDSFPSSPVLFVGVSPGLTVGVAVYRR